MCLQLPIGHGIVPQKRLKGIAVKLALLTLRRLS